MNGKKFYVTCAIPYVNAAPHIGHALEFIQGDSITRYHALLGEQTKLLSGGDENALKNVQAAEKAGMPLQEFIDGNTKKFQDLTLALGCSFDVWQKGSDKEHHFPSSQELWNRCKKDIYSKSYEGLYCVGCEAFYALDELNPQGECFEHPGKKLETVKETNYFFKLSSYQARLITLIESDTIRIVPEKRKNEILAFLKRGLDDISISRSNERARDWGVPVPDDDTQRMYVWFDALNIYQSGVGFGWDAKQYESWWPADVHVIGKGITRFHAVYWPAFLLSAGLSLPKTLFVHEYFTVNGQKMSKTLGNVIDPIELIKTYGAESLRYYFLAKFSPFNDGDFSEEEFKKTYNADLANGLGNLIARIATLITKTTLPSPIIKPKFTELIKSPAYHMFAKEFEEFQFNNAIAALWSHIKALDVSINEHAPWKLLDPERGIFLLSAANTIVEIATLLQPILPKTAESIIEQFTNPIFTIRPSLFQRIT